MDAKRCDFCGEVADCVQKEIDGREYDFCSRCCGELETRLRGKGREVSRREATLLPQNTPRTVEEMPEKPLPGGPTTIYGGQPS